MVKIAILEMVPTDPAHRASRVSLRPDNPRGLPTVPTVAMRILRGWDPGHTRWRACVVANIAAWSRVHGEAPTKGSTNRPLLQGK